MNKYHLTLTTEQGEVMERWTLAGEDVEDDDAFIYPLHRLGMVALATDINDAIKREEAERK